MIISVIGSGGKTTYIRELKDKYVSMNKTVLMCTTTHMLIEEDTLVDPGYDEIMHRIETYGYCHAGNRCGDLKIEALDEELFNQLKQVVDVILIEADGSKHLPLKYPNVNEPVLDSDTDEVVLISNLNGLNQPVKDVVHRYELANLDPNELVTPRIMQDLIRAYLKKLNKPVQMLKETMSCIEKGDLDARVHIDSNDEFQDIGNGMNQMAENLNKYVQKAYVAEIRQRDAELEALKRQIQPHYLYNTLDVIRMSAITNDDMLVATMIDSLSGQLKYLIGTTGNMVILQQEIACISNYFKLIEVRYDSRFSLSVEIPKELWKCRVPHLIIQPVVENAVKHGLRPNKGPGEVVVQAKQNMDFLEITVMDNGVGINKERLEEVQALLKSDARIAEEDIKGMSIGVKNVSDRIKHLYGNEYGLEIDAYEGMGTIVKFWLPLIWEDV